jgi:hypothetical protein
MRDIKAFYQIVLLPRRAIAQYVSNRFHQFLRHFRIDEAAKLTA